MKKLILIITLTAFSLASFAQQKADTAKKPVAKPAIAKPEYKADPNQVYTITLKLRAPQIFALTGTSAGIIHRHPQYTGEQIGLFEDDAKATCTNIQSQAQAQADSIYNRWKADTAANHGLLPVKKPKK